MSPVKDLFDFLPYGTTLPKMLLYFIGSAFVAFLISPIIIDILYKLNIKRKGREDATMAMDKADGKIGTPIMGGLIFVITTVIITILFNWDRQYTWLPMGAFVLSACLGGVDDLLNIFGGERKKRKPLRMHFKLARVHKNIFKRIFYLVTIPWAIFVRFFESLGSVSKIGLKPHEKILVQLYIGITVGLWVYTKLNWSGIWLPFLDFEPVRNAINFLPFLSVNESLGAVDIGWLMVPFIALTIMTVSNAVNITDGMDGLAAGLLIIAFGSYAIIAFMFSNYAPQQLGLALDHNSYQEYRKIAYLCMTVVGSLFAYLYFNVKPARVQMADVGSLSMGTLLSIVAVMLHREFTLLFIAGVILINGVITPMIQVLSMKIRGKRVFPMTPIHYTFKLKGWPEEKIVVRFWIFGAFLAAIGVYLAGI